MIVCLYLKIKMKSKLSHNCLHFFLFEVTRVIMSKIDTIYSKHSLRKAILLLNIPNPPKEDVALFLSLFQMSHFFQLRTAFNPDSSHVDDISRHSRIMINIGKCIIHWSIYHSLPLNFEDLHFLIKNNKVKEGINKILNDISIILFLRC